MREIEFRGKDKKTGEWRYGDLITASGRSYILPEYSPVSILGRHEWVDGFHEVIPETVGQYTGLKDKNGVKIYEGDVVLFSGHYLGDNFENELTETIQWYDREICYNWKLTGTGFQDGPEWCEVIGNIHDKGETHV